MQGLVIHGGRPLDGEMTVHGAKNSALPVLAACVLCADTCVLENCPAIDDVACAGQILEALGCVVTRSGGTLAVDAKGVRSDRIAAEQARRMRSSILFLGSVLARCGEATVPLPGGCELGPRPIDLHIKALRTLGVEAALEDGCVRCRLRPGCGGLVSLPYPSVGATENLMLAAAGFDRTVTVCNAAQEPEIVDLARFLTAMGMQVDGAGSDCITLRRAAPLHGTMFRIMPDRIEAATYLCAAAAAGGEVRLRDAQPDTLRPVLQALRQAGCTLRCHGGEITLRRRRPLRAVGTIVTAPYPGFPTDAQPPLMAAMATARGETRFVETVFSDRYRHAGALLEMGAQIRLDGRIALLTGVERLHGTRMEAADLRGGAALLVAALGAEGESTIFGLRHLARGYEALAPSLKMLGADIKQVEIL